MYTLIYEPSNKHIREGGKAENSVHLKNNCNCNYSACTDKYNIAIYVQKKVFCKKPYTPTPAPLYFSKFQQLAAFSNIRKPYTNPTLTLHPFLHS